MLPIYEISITDFARLLFLSFMFNIPFCSSLPFLLFSFSFLLKLSLDSSHFPFYLQCFFFSFLFLLLFFLVFVTDIFTCFTASFSFVYTFLRFLYFVYKSEIISNIFIMIVLFEEQLQIPLSEHGDASESNIQENQKTFTYRLIPLTEYE